MYVCVCVCMCVCVYVCMCVGDQSPTSLYAPTESSLYDTESDAALIEQIQGLQVCVYTHTRTHVHTHMYTHARTNERTACHLHGMRSGYVACAHAL